MSLLFYFSIIHLGLIFFFFCMVWGRWSNYFNACWDSYNLVCNGILIIMTEFSTVFRQGEITNDSFNLDLLILFTEHGDWHNVDENLNAVQWTIFYWFIFLLFFCFSFQLYLLNIISSVLFNWAIICPAFLVSKDRSLDYWFKTDLSDFLLLIFDGI